MGKGQRGADIDGGAGFGGQDDYSVQTSGESRLRLALEKGTLRSPSP